MATIFTYHILEGVAVFSFLDHRLEISQQLSSEAVSRDQRFGFIVSRACSFTWNKILWHVMGGLRHIS